MVAHQNQIMRNRSPTDMHMFLCAVIPLSIFFVLLLCVSPDVAMIISFLSAFAVMFVGTPLTAWLYRRIISKHGTFDENAVVHTTDAGGSSLIFLFMFFILWPLLEKVVVRLFG
jgi:hypothetical protein